MKKYNFIAILISLIILSCSKNEEVVVPASGNLEVNTWFMDGTVSKLSAYGFGWASTDFSPRAGWTDITTIPNETRAIEVSVLSKPVAAGKYTVELYADVHLNKVRTNKITGNKVGMTARIGNTTYQSEAGAGEMDISIAGTKTKLVFKNVVLKDISSAKTIKTSGNLEYAN